MISRTTTFSIRPAPNLPFIYPSTPSALSFAASPSACRRQSCQTFDFWTTDVGGKKILPSTTQNIFISYRSIQLTFIQGKVDFFSVYERTTSTLNNTFLCQQPDSLKVRYDHKLYLPRPLWSSTRETLGSGRKQRKMWRDQAKTEWLHAWLIEGIKLEEKWW